MQTVNFPKNMGNRLFLTSVSIWPFYVEPPPIRFAIKTGLSASLVSNCLIFVLKFEYISVISGKNGCRKYVQLLKSMSLLSAGVPLIGRNKRQVLIPIFRLFFSI